MSKSTSSSFPKETSPPKTSFTLKTSRNALRDYTSSFFTSSSRVRKYNRLNNHHKYKDSWIFLVLRRPNLSGNQGLYGKYGWSKCFRVPHAHPVYEPSNQGYQWYIDSFEADYSETEWIDFFDDWKNEVPDDMKHLEFSSCLDLYERGYKVLDNQPYRFDCSGDLWNWYNDTRNRPYEVFGNEETEDIKEEFFEALSHFQLLEEFMYSLDSALTKLMEYKTLLKFKHPNLEAQHEDRINLLLYRCKSVGNTFYNKYYNVIQLLNSRFLFMSSHDPQWILDPENRKTACQLFDYHTKQNSRAADLRKLYQDSNAKTEKVEKKLSETPLQLKNHQNLLGKHSALRHLNGKYSPSSSHQKQHKAQFYTRFYYNQKPLSGYNYLHMNLEEFNEKQRARYQNWSSGSDSDMDVGF